MDHRAGGVVGSADKDQPGARGYRGGHGHEVVSGMRVQRDPYRDRAGDRHDDRVCLERAPGVDDLIARVASSGDDLSEDAHASCPGGDVLGRDAEALRQCLGQLADGHVRIPVHLRGGVGNHSQHTGQWWVRILVTADLVYRGPLAADCWLAGLVCRDRSQRLAKTDSVCHRTPRVQSRSLRAGRRPFRLSVEGCGFNSVGR